MGRRMLRGEQHLAHVALADLVGLAEHPDLLERRRVEGQQHGLDEGLADGPRLAQHPDLLPLLGVLVAEHLCGEGAADLARLGEHPALLRLAGGERGGAGDGELLRSGPDVCQYDYRNPSSSAQVIYGQDNAPTTVAPGATATVGRGYP